jgi:hypothetical protein
MYRKWLAFVAAVGVAGMIVIPAQGQEKPKPKVTVPDAGVPQAGSIEGKFVRAVWNNEGYVIMGYQVANRSIGDEHMMLDLGTTVLGNTPEYKLKRDAISVTTPDNKTIPLMTVEEYRKADVRAIESRARVQRDSINYFPPQASQGCRIGFFAEPNSPALAWDEVAVSNRRACAGRLFFTIPGGIKYGQYYLNVKFAGSELRAPFRILTEDEEKLLGKNYKDIKKQVEEHFFPDKKKK